LQTAAPQHRDRENRKAGNVRSDAAAQDLITQEEPLLSPEQLSIETKTAGKFRKSCRRMYFAPRIKRIALYPAVLGTKTDG
jgi:hypothetical protein